MAKDNTKAIFEARRAINEAKAALKKVVQGRIEKKRIIVRGTDLIPVSTNGAYKTGVNSLRRQLLTLLQDCDCHESHKTSKGQSLVYVFTIHLGKWQTYPSQLRKKDGKPKSRARILRAIVRTPLHRVRNISY
ncbi:hypothetical protein PG993_010739 [Apiospora rasikravindrae]|uniref:Uncharacterized protein n=1 Tax=Apiospora rasikravindrae TaxID=990691 RepID=A0ABR1SCE4_9PEZI